MATETKPPELTTADEPDYDDWVECYQCHGEGKMEDCFEDLCVCVDPPCCWSRCDVCEGKGGWHAADEDTESADASTA